jgi:hypothetical protein
MEAKNPRSYQDSANPPIPAELKFVTEEKIHNWFMYHAPKGDQAGRYEDIRTVGRELARAMLQHCPESPERTTAINKVREAIMWANASIACNE